MSIINGKYCDIDYTIQPTKVDWAKSIVNYVDQKVPLIFRYALNQPTPNYKVQIEIVKDNVTRFAQFSFNGPNNGKISINEHLNQNDEGTFIHELVHWTQLFTGVTQAKESQGVKIYDYLHEAVADYFRIILSNDGKGDTGDNTKEFLPQRFDITDKFNSGSEFIAHLRLRSRKCTFVRDLNQILATNDTDQMDAYFTRIFLDTHVNLRTNYEKYRASILVNDPITIRRFDYFTQ
ncbi:MAG: hypothetical protein AB9842_07775 [Bacteroidales bacterium]